MQTTREEFEVKLESHGPAGYVYYSENGETLKFDWQRGTKGFDVYLPTPDSWNAFCEKYGAFAAKNRRQEIVTRMAQRIKREHAWCARVMIDDTGITFSYEHSILGKLLRKILGLN